MPYIPPSDFSDVVCSGDACGCVAVSSGELKGGLIIGRQGGVPNPCAIFHGAALSGSDAARCFEHTTKRPERSLPKSTRGNVKPVPLRPIRLTGGNISLWPMTHRMKRGNGLHSLLIDNPMLARAGLCRLTHCSARFFSG